MKKKILIATGGTGGHIFPAQGLADQLQRRAADIEVLFIGGGLNKNRYFEKGEYPYKEVACSSFQTPSKLYKILQGAYQSYRIILDFKPDAIVGFGSYYTLPPLLGAMWGKIPIILHEANSIPGRAIRWMAPFAKEVGVHFPETISLLKGKGVEVGLPLRKAYTKDTISREDSLRYFGLKENVTTLLIFGGSQGAEAINKIMTKIKIPNGIQIIHLTGNENSASEMYKNYTSQGVEACVKAYEKEMFRAWAVADFFISRAGASTIAEAMEFEVPGVLIPYPYATDNHQEKNADFFVSRIKGGIKWVEHKDHEQLLLESIEKLANTESRPIMSKAIQDYKSRAHSMNLCDLILRVV